MRLSSRYEINQNVLSAAHAHACFTMANHNRSVAVLRPPLHATKAHSILSKMYFRYKDPRNLSLYHISYRVVFMSAIWASDVHIGLLMNAQMQHATVQTSFDTLARCHADVNQRRIC